MSKSGVTRSLQYPVAVVSTHWTIKELRDKSELGISDIVQMALITDRRFPKSHSGYLDIEANGTRDYWKILALSRIFGFPVNIMAHICHPDRYHPSRS